MYRDARTGAAALYRIVGLAAHTPGQTIAYTVARHNADGRWHFITPTDLNHEQMQTWHRRRTTLGQLRTRPRRPA